MTDDKWDALAREIGNQWWGRFIGVSTIESFRSSIAAALKAAVDGEREAGAKFIEDGCGGWISRDFKYQAAEAFRSRT